MEQIYTIPVNEAFEKSAADKSCGCPFCTLFNILEENELDLILGASMMEPDVRIKTNEIGFCKIHYDMMFVRKNRLGLALMMESHLEEIVKKMSGGMFSNPIASLEKLDKTCYVCDRIEYNFSRMIETAALLWDNDPMFHVKTTSQPYFCLPHYQRFVSAAKLRMNKKKYNEFYKQVSELEMTYLKKLKEDVSWFCKKFDYRYEDEPWYDSKDAVERTIKFLGSNTHLNEK